MQVNQLATSRSVKTHAKCFLQGAGGWLIAFCTSRQNARHWSRSAGGSFSSSSAFHTPTRSGSRYKLRSRPGRLARSEALAASGSEQPKGFGSKFGHLLSGHVRCVDNFSAAGRNRKAGNVKAVL